jgi:EPS-associated MarR family transcriptional regulator
MDHQLLSDLPAEQAVREPGMAREETEYWAMHVLEQKPDATQRDLAQELGVSLGKAHYCIKSLIEKGWLKAVPRRKGDDRRGYRYLLTRLGQERKAHLTVRFVASKMREYEGLLVEFDRLQRDARRRARRSSREQDRSTDGEER